MTIDRGDRLRDLDDTAWEALNALGRAFRVDDGSLTATFEAILKAAVTTIEGTDFAGLNLLVDGAFEPQAVLGQPANELDALAQRAGVGPCIDAARLQTVYRIDDIAAVGQWPEYTAAAAALGVRAVLCVPMWIDSGTQGSVSLFSRSVGVFDGTAEKLAALFGVHASLALVDARRRENLATALHNRDVIGQAKGILMERHRLTAEAAFELLSKASQRSNRKLAVIAEEFTNTGMLIE